MFLLFKENYLVRYTKKKTYNYKREMKLNWAADSLFWHRSSVFNKLTFLTKPTVAIETLWLSFIFKNKSVINTYLFVLPPWLKCFIVSAFEISLHTHELALNVVQECLIKKKIYQLSDTIIKECIQIYKKMSKFLSWTHYFATSHALSEKKNTFVKVWHVLSSLGLYLIVVRDE